MEAANQEQSTFLAYDKRVKELAAELTGKENSFVIQATSSTVNFPNAAEFFLKKNRLMVHPATLWRSDEVIHYVQHLLEKRGDLITS